MTLSGFIISWLPARKAIEQIEEITEQTSTQYVGQEVTYTWPVGKKENAVIVAMDYSKDTYDRIDNKWGAWVYTIRLMRDGTQTTAGSESMVFTGRYYADINAKRPLAQNARIVWNTVIEEKGSE